MSLEIVLGVLGFWMVANQQTACAGPHPGHTSVHFLEDAKTVFGGIAFAGQTRANLIVAARRFERRGLGNFF